MRRFAHLGAISLGEGSDSDSVAGKRKLAGFGHCGDPVRGALVEDRDLEGNELHLARGQEKTGQSMSSFGGKRRGEVVAEKKKKTLDAGCRLAEQLGPERAAVRCRRSGRPAPNSAATPSAENRHAGAKHARLLWRARALQRPVETERSRSRDPTLGKIFGDCDLMTATALVFSRVQRVVTPAVLVGGSCSQQCSTAPSDRLEKSARHFFSLKSSLAPTGA